MRVKRPHIGDTVKDIKKQKTGVLVQKENGLIILDQEFAITMFFEINTFKSDSKLISSYKNYIVKQIGTMVRSCDLMTCRQVLIEYDKTLKV